MNSSLRKKFIIFGSSILIFVAMYIYDTIRADNFHIEVVEMLPNPAVADGQTPVTIKLHLQDRHGNAVEDHSLFALPHTGGMFHSSREVTDKNGNCTFIYYPYKTSSITKLQDAVLSFTDESNSVFIEIGSSTKVTLKLLEPKKVTVSNDLLKGIFGD